MPRRDGHLDAVPRRRARSTEVPRVAHRIPRLRTTRCLVPLVLRPAQRASATETARRGRPVRSSQATASARRSARAVRARPVIPAQSRRRRAATKSMFAFPTTRRAGPRRPHVPEMRARRTRAPVGCATGSRRPLDRQRVIPAARTPASPTVATAATTATLRRASASLRPQHVGAEGMMPVRPTRALPRLLPSP